MDRLARHVDPEHYLGVIGMAADIRSATPPRCQEDGPTGDQAWALNAFISGGLKSIARPLSQ